MEFNALKVLQKNELNISNIKKENDSNNSFNFLSNSNNSNNISPIILPSFENLSSKNNSFSQTPTKNGSNTNNGTQSKDNFKYNLIFNKTKNVREEKQESGLNLEKNFKINENEIVENKSEPKYNANFNGIQYQKFDETYNPNDFLTFKLSEGIKKENLEKIIENKGEINEETEEDEEGKKRIPKNTFYKK